MPHSYRRAALAHGLTPPPAPEILARFRAAYARPWRHGGSRFAGDGKPFWRFCVAASLGLPAHALPAACFDELYDYYADPTAAWRVAPGAVDALAALRRAGVRVGVVSNFDARLPSLLEGLGLAPYLDRDAVVTSADTGLEKPNPEMFRVCLDRLAARAAARIAPADALVVGDDRRNDVAGGRAAGMHAVQVGVDGVEGLGDVVRLVLGESEW